MSVDEVERVFLHSLNNSCSPDPKLREEALNVMDELKGNVQNATTLFQLLCKSGIGRPEVSMALIQILEDFLGRGEEETGPTFDSQLRVAFVKDFLMIHVIEAPNASNVPNYLKNKISQFILTSFINERLAGTWPNACAELIRDLANPSTSLGLELFLRFCLILNEEISKSSTTQTFRNQRKLSLTKLLSRYANIRDAMRADGDNAKLCQVWRSLLQESSDERIILLSMECLAGFSTWIDVNLVVEAEMLKLIYAKLQSPQTSIQLGAADCLAEVVGKGMLAQDKISLADYMNLASVFEAVGQRGVLDFFFSKICKVLNSLGYSLIQQIHLNPQAVIFHAQGTPITVQEQVVEYTCPVLLPHLLRCLNLIAVQPGNVRESSIWLDSLQALLPFLAAVFETARSMKQNLRPDQTEFMGHLLPLLMKLLERPSQSLFEEDDVLLGDASEVAVVDEDDEYMFTIRPALFRVFDSIAFLQGHATLGHLQATCKSTSPERFGLIELLTQLTMRLPEALKGHPSFVITINRERQLTPITEIICWIEDFAGSGNRRMPLSLQLTIGEMIVRYSSTSFLDVLPDRVEVGLQFLMSLVEASRFNRRSCDLLLKYVRSLKGRISVYASMLLNGLQGPMSARQTRFTSVYELAGMAVAALDSTQNYSPASITASLLQSTLERGLVTNGANEKDTLEAAQAVELLAAFVKGYTTDPPSDASALRAWFTDALSLFCSSTVFEAANTGSAAKAELLGQLIGFAQRLIALCQDATIKLIERIFIHLKNNTSTSFCSVLLSQFLPLLTGMIFKLRQAPSTLEFLRNHWVQLCDVILRVLQASIQGTDDVIQHANVAKAFLALLQGLLTSIPNDGAALLEHFRAHTSLESIFSSIFELICGPEAAFDPITLTRALLGQVTKTLPFLNPEFVYAVFIPGMFTRLLPHMMGSLEAASRRHLQGLPAGLAQLTGDFASLLETAGTVEPQPGLTWSAFPNGVITGRREEVRDAILTYYVQLLMNK